MPVEKCPVCGGNGIVSNGFYNQTSGYWSTTTTAPETCRSCNGQGYVETKECKERESFYYYP